MKLTRPLDIIAHGAKRGRGQRVETAHDSPRHRAERDPHGLVSALETARAARPRVVETAALGYEIDLAPPPGAQVVPCTVAGQYRTPVPILFDPRTRTAFPQRAR